MPAIGITGGISTGKSTFVECLRELLPAATFFDADEAAHALLNRPEVEKQIRQRIRGASVFKRRRLESNEASRHSVRRRDQKTGA